jgi:hypothetical protein
MGVKVLKSWFLIEHASFATTLYIDTSARGPVSRVYAHIYTAIYRTANHPYTRVSDLGSPRVTGSQGNQVSKYPRITGSRVTGSRRRKVTGSRVTRATLSQGHWIIYHARIYLHGSDLQGLHGHRVTITLNLGSLGNQVSKHPSIQVSRFSGSHITK